MRKIILVLLALLAGERAAMADPRRALELALADARSLPPEVAGQRRYLWCHKRSKTQHTAVAFVVNSALSHSTVDVTPTVLADGELVAIDLDKCELRHDVWERYVKDEPYFHVPARVKAKTSPYRARDGKTYDYKFVSSFVAAPYLGQAAYDLESLTGSATPIVRADWWLTKSLDTVNGGLYFDLRGIEPGKTKLDDYLVSRGASREQAKRLNSDEKAAMMSAVTGKPRGITMFATSGVRLSTGIGVASITDDPFDETDDADFDPYRNLLDSKTNGHEVFVVMVNGWIEYTIWDANGNLVREAPPNLVADHRIPAPYTRRLQGAISCIRCHASSDMWQPFVNEVALMLGQSNLDVVEHDQRTLERLAGLYSGDLQPVLTAARDSFSRRVFAVTRTTVPEAASAVASVYGDYVYDKVGPLTACEELGISVKEGDSLGTESFKAAVPPVALFEDPIISRLYVFYDDPDTKSKRALTLTRRQWELVYADAMTRMLKHASN